MEELITRKNVTYKVIYDFFFENVTEDDFIPMLNMLIQRFRWCDHLLYEMIQHIIKKPVDAGRLAFLYKMISSIENGPKESYPPGAGFGYRLVEDIPALLARRDPVSYPAFVDHCFMNGIDDRAEMMLLTLPFGREYYPHFTRLGSDFAYRFYKKLLGYFSPEKKYHPLFFVEKIFNRKIMPIGPNGRRKKQYLFDEEQRKNLDLSYREVFPRYY